LLEMVPKKDEQTGICYTKLQIRRMMKRVKKGLPPVPTPQEEQERLRNEAQLRREEQAEREGVIYNKVEEDASTTDSLGDNNNGDIRDDDNKNDEGQTEINNHNKKRLQDNSTDNVYHTEDLHDNEDHQPPKKLAKRSKPVPLDYVCQACKNNHEPLHWIYDCPDKVTVRGTNQKKKSERGLHDPDSRKVFVSGLPFDVKSKDVCTIFEPACGKVSSCKLLTFEDTKRCNGQAYLTFESDQAATNAIKLSGMTMNRNQLPDRRLKKNNETTSPCDKDLKLTVSRVLNRKKTKKAS